MLVIGGGVLGAFHAYHALQRGLRVHLVERNSVPKGATVRSFGQVVPSGLDQQWQAFGRRSLEVYAEVQAKFDVSIRRNGTFYLASDQDELKLLEELHAINLSNQYLSELLSQQACLKKFPQLRADYCVAGLYFPDEISVNPRRMIHQLHAYLASHANYEAFFSSTVTKIESDSSCVSAFTSDGLKLTADQTIVCSGADFQTLFPSVFLESDLVAVKLQMLRLKPQSSVQMSGNVLTGSSIRRYESFSECPSWQAIKSKEESDSFAKRWGIHILFKQEADGSIILGDSHEYAPAKDIDSLTFEIRDDINRYFVEEGKRIFDLPCWEIDSAWLGVYSQTDHPNGIFTESISDRVHVVTGIGGKGMTSSAGFAEHQLGVILND